MAKWVQHFLGVQVRIQTEREINTFFRLGQTRVKAQLRVDFPDLPADMDEETVFTRLRELRNRW